MKCITTFTFMFLIGAAIVAATTVRPFRAECCPQCRDGGTDKPVEKLSDVTCTLNTSDRRGRQTVLDKLGRGIIKRKELADGFAFGFPAEDEWLTAIAEVVALERKCCSLLTFKIVVEPDNGLIWLELAGPEGTKEFLRKELGL